MTLLDAALTDPWIAYCLGLATMGAIWCVAQIVMIVRIERLARRWDREHRDRL
jgi:hypothetical protein